MSIKPVSSTMGQSAPSGGGYHYKRDPRWVPNDPRYCPKGTAQPGEPLPQNVKATTAKQRRMAEYARLRLEGVSKDQAAAEIGVSSSTANYYERDFQDRQRGEGTECLS